MSIRRSKAVGGLVLGTDPLVEEAGVDVGYSPDDKNMRAPDIAVGNVPDRPGWVPGAPRIAVEYAARGQDEAELQDKIAELLARGTEHVWVVRPLGPRRVEVHRPGQPMQTLQVGDRLEAPGILQNPVPVEALFDRESSLDQAFLNLLQRQGYQSLDEVAQEGELRTLRETLMEVLELRQLGLDDGTRQRIADCADTERLRRWHRRAITAASLDAVFDA